MKKFTSIYALAGRLTLFRILAVILLLPAVQTAAFYFYSKPPAPEGAIANGLLPFLEIISKPLYSLSFAAAFLLSTVFLIRMASNLSGSFSRYTMQRLSADRRTIAVAAALYALSCFLILWAVQVGTLIGLSEAYLSMEAAAYPIGTPAAAQQPVLLLAAGTPGFANYVFPFADLFGHLRNMLMLLGISSFIGILTAYRQKDGLSAAAIFIICAFLADFELLSFFGFVASLLLLMISIGTFIKNPDCSDTDEKLSETAADENTADAEIEKEDGQL